MPATVVDCHCHIFNVQDLPIDGFLRKLSPLPSLLTGALSLPFDHVLSWIAADSSAEGDVLLDRLAAAGAGLEAPGGPGAVDPGFPSDVEMERRAIERWPLTEGGPALGEEGPGDWLAARIEQASPEQLAELDAYLLENGEPDVVRALEDERAGLEGPANWLARADGVRTALRLFMDLLRRVTRYRRQVAEELAATYPEVALFVPALVDYSQATHDDPATPVHEQIAVHALLAKLSVVGGLAGAPQARIHPMVGFSPLREVATTELRGWDIDSGLDNPYVPYADPATATAEDLYRPDLPYDPCRARAIPPPNGPWHRARLDIPAATRSIDLVRHAVERGGFAAVKVYPPSGFLPIGNDNRFGERIGSRMDAALRTLYRYCETMQVPILTHAAHSVAFDKDFDDFAGPSGWAPVLRDYPQLRLCLGHFGHLQAVKPDGLPGPDSWLHRFLALIDQYEHVYADVSNSQLVYNEAYRRQYVAALHSQFADEAGAAAVIYKRRRRLVFGSDYWLNTMHPGHPKFYSTFTEVIAGSFGPDARDWFAGTNALRFLGLVGDDDQPDPTNLNRARLIAFYEGFPRPPWL